jgi:hypothetical protein
LINADIARILNLSKATVSKILHGGRNFSKHTIDRVLYYKDLEFNVVEKIFKEIAFRKICETVLDKVTKKDSEKFVELERFAAQCLRWHEYFIKNKDYTEIDSITIASMNKNLEPFKLLTDSSFWDLMNLGIRLCKDREVKMRAVDLQGLSYNLRKSMRL